MHLILEEILPSTSSQTKKKGKGGTDHDSEVMEQDEEILEVDGDERENVQTETSAKNLQDPLLLTKCNLVVIEGTTPSSAQYLGKKLFCLPCDKTFRSESSLKSHNQLAHSGKTSIQAARRRKKQLTLFYHHYFLGYLF